MRQRKPNERAASDTLPVIPEAPPLCATVSGLLVPLKPAVSEKMIIIVTFTRFLK